MYKIAIVDDEQLIRRGIAARIQKLNSDFKIVGEASNGEEALQLFRKEKPHLIITDIRMPFMDGLELIAEIRKLSNSTKFIIVSGFTDFEYAKQAIKMGIIGYLLKPISDTELNFYLEKASGELDSEMDFQMIETEHKNLHKVLEKYQKEQILSNLLLSEQTLLTDYTVLFNDSKFQNPHFVLFLLRIDLGKMNEQGIVYSELENVHRKLKDQLGSLKGINNIIVISDPRNISQFLVAIAHQSSDYLEKSRIMIAERIKNQITENNDLSYIVAYSSVHPRISPDMYNEVSSLVIMRFVRGWNSTYSPFQENLSIASIPGEKINLLSQYLDTTSYNDLRKLLNDLFLPTKEITITPQFIKGYFVDIIRFLKQYAEKNQLDWNSIEDIDLLNPEILDRLSGLDDLLDFLTGYFINIGNKTQNMGSDARDRALQARIYIAEHYMEDKSVKDIASRFNLSPTYFSILFKDLTGTTVKKYINQKRVDSACELLKKSDANVSEIAATLGFQDVQYFHRVFKSIIGKTPLSYRFDIKN